VAVGHLPRRRGARAGRGRLRVELAPPRAGHLPALAKAGGNYLNSQLAKMEARADGYAEGIVLDNFGYVSEGSGENLFLVRDGVLHTTGLESGILQGITRDSVITIARELGVPVREARLPREMLLLADELFFTGTAAELTPIRSVDRQPVGDGRPGEITRAIQDRYLGIARGRYPDAHGWRTPVPLAAPVLRRRGPRAAAGRLTVGRARDRRGGGTATPARRVTNGPRARSLWQAPGARTWRTGPARRGGRPGILRTSSPPGEPSRAGSAPRRWA
jgi:hypothetical protein